MRNQSPERGARDVTPTSRAYTHRGEGPYPFSSVPRLDREGEEVRARGCNARGEGYARGGVEVHEERGDTMTTESEIQVDDTTPITVGEEGLLIRGGTNAVVGYVFLFGDKGAFDPDGRLEGLTQEDVDRHNAALSALEVKGIREQLPERIAGYINGEDDRHLRTFIGAEIGRVVWRGKESYTFGGATRQWVRVMVGEGTRYAAYGGYATDTRDLVYLRKLKGREMR